MAFDAKQIFVGVVFYSFAVVAPTVHVMFEHYGLESTIMERVTTGILGVVTLSLVWQGVRGERSPADPSTVRQRYFGINPLPLAAALALLYVAWVSNILVRVAGTVDGGIFVFTDGEVLRLGTIWQRILTSLTTYAGLALLFKYGLRTTRTPEERRARRETRRQAKQAKQQAVMERAATPHR